MTTKQYAGLAAITLLGGLVGGAGMSWFLSGQPVFAQKTPAGESIIEAKSFHLVDKNGVLRGGLTTLEDGTAGLILSNNSAKPVIKLIVTPGGKSGITLYDNNDRVRALFIVQPDGTPALNLKSGQKNSAALSFNPDGSPFLSFWDKDGKQRVVLGDVDADTARANPVEKR